jgi:hypothetical protein
LSYITIVVAFVLAVLAIFILKVDKSTLKRSAIRRRTSLIAQLIPVSIQG